MNNRLNELEELKESAIDLVCQKEYKINELMSEIEKMDGLYREQMD